MKRYNYFAGVDLHKSVIQVCVLDASGEVVHESRHTGGGLKAGRRALAELTPFSCSLQLAVEAVGFNRWLVRDAVQLGASVVVADASKLRLKASGVKTDRRDAYELARRLRLGDLERDAKTYFPTEKEYGERKLLRARHELVVLRTVLVNQIRAIFAAYRIDSPKAPLYGKRSLELLSQAKLPNEMLQSCMESFIGPLKAIQVEVERIDKAIARRASERADWLLQLPSVGPLTALTIVSELGCAARFSRSREVASYAGLAPRVHASADRAVHGRLTKRGNRLLRFVLGEWAVRLMSFDEHAKRWAAQHARIHRNKLRSALARRLLIGTWRTMRTGEAFDLHACLPVH